jgi:hypothetical protein
MSTELAEYRPKSILRNLLPLPVFRTLGFHLEVSENTNLMLYINM